MFVLSRENRLSSCCVLREISGTEWMIDSGASKHFTNNLNDFVDYKPLTKPEFAYMAKGITPIAGKGTVILHTNDKTIRIYPVWYIDGLSTRLLSLGTFLKKGLTITGEGNTLSL